MDDECVEELGKPISSLKVTELRDELQKRALTKTGNKKELIDRLRAAIQRQSAQSAGGAVTVDQLPHIGGQEQQQQYQQSNVPQYLNTAVATIQQQAPTYQLNQLQPQPQIATYLPINPQQFPQAIIQPLDLQQQLTDYQAQVQQQIATAEYQQQQQQMFVTQQQYESTNVASQPPPIDMRVQQQQVEELSKTNKQEVAVSGDQGTQIHPQESAPIDSSKSQETESIDLTNKQEDLGPKNKDLSLESSTENILIENETKQKGEKLEEEEEVSKSESGQVTDAQQEDGAKQATSTYQVTEGLSKADDGEEEAQRDVKEKVSTQETEITHPISQSDSGQTEEQHDDYSLPSTKKSDDKVENYSSTDNPGQSAPISLKRGRSEVAGKEKRRKWSTRNPELRPNDSQEGESSIHSGDSSSQKPHELIEEKSADKASKDVKTADSLDASDEVEELETAQESALLQQSNSEKNKDFEKDQKTQKEVNQEKETAQSKAPEFSEIEQEPSKGLLVQNLVRPFTIPQLKEVLSQHGPIIEDKFWTDKIKSKCCVMYESIELARLTRESLHNQQWPSSNPKTLRVSYITDEEFLNFQLSEQVVKNVEKKTKDSHENGQIVESASKPITDRLGQRVPQDDGDASADTVKRRLGERVSGDIDIKTSNIDRGDGVDDEGPQELDDLFKKTKSVPHLFWLPLTEDQADVRQKVRQERVERNQELAQKARRSPPPRRRSPVPRHRSPSRSPRRSPPRFRSPMSRRSPPLRHRSPLLGRRSPPGRARSPLLRRPSPRRRSPLQRASPPRRRSPIGASMRSSPPRRRSPMLMRRSPPPMQRSPIRRSSPAGPIRRSPGPIRRSPGLMRRSPGMMGGGVGGARRSPLLQRRSPAPIRGSSPYRRSPQRKRSPMRRRSPLLRQQPISPLSSGYNSEQRRPQRLDRLR